MPSYDVHQRQRRQTYGASARGTSWGHYLPLAITVTIAAGGLAAWIWKERQDHSEDEYGHDRPPPGSSEPPGYGPGPSSSGYGPIPPDEFHDRPPPGFSAPPTGQAQYRDAPGQSSQIGLADDRTVEEESIVSKMSGALRRTPSPQQIFDGASKRVVAGVAAAGAVVGGALSSITEEDKRDYEDHRSWSEEADSQNGGNPSGSSRKGPKFVDSGDQHIITMTKATGNSIAKRKSVAIVVSAATSYDHDDEASYHQENASILSHLPEHLTSESRIFVLIYAPDLKQHPLGKTADEGQLPASMGSSFSNIAREDAQSPDAGLTRSKTFDTLYMQAQALVDKDTMIMPFATMTGYIPMLRHLGPEAVYLQASLAGEGGAHLSDIRSWVDQIVIVVGDDSGHGGLVDSEDEHSGAADKWWINDSRIGLGKGVEVVDGLRVGEDFRRRIGGHD